MSSFSVDASGNRGVTTTTGDPKRTYTSVPAKVGDSATVGIGGFTELSGYLTGKAKLQVLRIPSKSEEGESAEEVYIRLVVPGGHLNLRCVGPEQGWPHVQASVKKDLEEDYFMAKGGYSQNGGEELASFEVGELLADREPSLVSRSEILEAARALLVASTGDFSRENLADAIEARNHLSDIVARAS